MIKHFFLLPLLLVGLMAGPLRAESKQDNPALATIGSDLTITKFDVINYARPLPNLYPYLTIPGGPKRILEDMIRTRLLIMEGERLGMPRSGAENGGDTAYAIAVRLRLAPRCAPPAESAVRAFYDAHPDQFSSPLFLRLNRFGLRYTPDNRNAVNARLQAMAARLSGGEVTFAAIAADSDDEFDRFRGGDLGFVAQEDASNPIMAELAKAKTGQVIGPLEQGEMLYLYQVSGRREPVPESYESVRVQAAEKQQSDCYRQRVEAMFDTLKARWPVKILLDNLDTPFEAK
ncbi:MAG: peptidyl-prolyl cis-trans isomerase [Sulfuricella denitrificans]|nr:peptidyl-prolyl cis-trans isomerase [Sulfuricella denitrificans]